MKSSILPACCNLVALCALVLHITARAEAAEDLMAFSYGRRNIDRIVEGLVHDKTRRIKKSSTASSKDSSTKSSKHKSSKSSKAFSSKSGGKGHGTHHSSSKTSKSKSKGKGGKGKGGKNKGKGSHNYVDSDDSFSAGGSATDDSSLMSSSSDPSHSHDSGSGDGYGSVSSTGAPISNAPVLSSVSAPSGSKSKIVGNPVASPPSSKSNKTDNVGTSTVGSATSKSPTSKGSGKDESSGGKEESPEASPSATYSPSIPSFKSNKTDNVGASTVGSVTSKSPTSKGSGKGEDSGGKVSNGVTSAPSSPSGAKGAGKKSDSGKDTSSSPSPTKSNGKQPTKDKADKSTNGASFPSMSPTSSPGSGSYVDGKKTSYPSSAPSLSPALDSSLSKSDQPKGMGDKSISHETKLSPSAPPTAAEQSDTDSRTVNVMVCADEYETAGPNEYSVPLSFTYSFEMSGGDTDVLPKLEEKILMVAAESMLACSTRRVLNYSNQSVFRKHDRIQYFGESASTKYSHSRIRQLKEPGGKDVAKGEKDRAPPKGKQDDSSPQGTSSKGAIVKFMSSPTDRPSITQTCEPKEDSSNTCTIVIAGMTFVQTNAEGSDENASLLLQTIQDSMRNGELLPDDIPNLISVDFLAPEPHSKSLEEVGLQDEEDNGTLAIGFAFMALACALLIAIAVVGIQKFRNSPTPKDDADSCDKACEVLDHESSHGGQTRDLEVLSIQCSTIQCCSSEESTGSDNRAYREPNVNTPGTVHSTMDVHHCSSSTCNLCRQHDKSPKFIRVDDFDDNDDDEEGLH